MIVNRGCTKVSVYIIIEVKEERSTRDRRCPLSKFTRTRINHLVIYGLEQSGVKAIADFVFLLLFSFSYMCIHIYGMRLTHAILAPILRRDYKFGESICFAQHGGGESLL